MSKVIGAGALSGKGELLVGTKTLTKCRLPSRCTCKFEGRSSRGLNIRSRLCWSAF